MKKYIKTFMAMSPAFLDKQVNDFLMTLDLKKVNIEIQYRTYHYKHSVMIIVTNEKENINEINTTEWKGVPCTNNPFSTSGVVVSYSGLGKIFHYNNVDNK